jgi:hypothetical protein
LHRDPGSRAIDLAEVNRRQFDVNRPEVLFEAMRLRRAWDGDDPWLLGQQPRERDLSGRRLLPCRYPRQQIDQGLVRSAVLRSEARDGIAEVGAAQLGVLIDLARKKAPTQRAVRDKADAEFFQRRQNLFLGASPPQREV